MELEIRWRNEVLPQLIQSFSHPRISTRNTCNCPSVFSSSSSSFFFFFVFSSFWPSFWPSGSQGSPPDKDGPRTVPPGTAVLTTVLSVWGQPSANLFPIEKSLFPCFAHRFINLFSSDLWGTNYVTDVIR